MKIYIEAWDKKIKTRTMPFELTDIGDGGIIKNQTINAIHPNIKDCEVVKIEADGDVIFLA